MISDHPHCFLCKHSLPEWYDAIAARSEIVAFKRGQVLFTEGEPASHFYFLHGGTIKVHKQWGAAKDLIIKFAAPGDVLGHRGMGKEQHFPVTATALEAGSACRISTEFFLSSLKVNNGLAISMMMLYAGELQEAEHKMRNMVHMDVKGRIAEALLTIRQVFGTDAGGNINNLLTKQDIASYAGTTYETLFKVLNEWGQEGIVAVSGKDIRIEKEKKLKGFILY
ncbi:Crp/Fnr family transcriptional regulator [Chitinophaga alhagiae]|uniref:Crp/Fnr family transcriptional regulator n=1 Tax=Chitinophaga alhagiae TaxID=2203219 RepID=UPI000E5A5B79|nr:Crp/Fnr family transcriptional regulator [Chitinophaga alhagiae]